jgi:hypothetical protein
VCLGTPLIISSSTNRICPGRFLGSRSVWIGVTRLLWAFDISPALDKAGVPIPVDPYHCTSGITSCVDFLSFIYCSDRSTDTIASQNRSQLALSCARKPTPERSGRRGRTPRPRPDLVNEFPSFRAKLLGPSLFGILVLTVWDATTQITRGLHLSLEPQNFPAFFSSSLTRI